MRVSLATLVMLVAAQAAHSQGVPLDKLSNCALVSEASSWLSSPAPVAGSTCRQAGDDAERRLLGDWSSSLDSKRRQSCLSTSAVLPSLNGFSCLTARRDGKASSAFCFRRVNGAPLRAYRENYAQVYARRVAGYFSRSAQCDGVMQSGHKARIAGVSLPSTDMLSIASPAFGYESRLRANGGLARLEHGFGFLDPKLASGGKDAIEYVSVDAGDVHRLDRVVQNSVRAGEWTIDSARIDDVVGMARDMAAGNPAMKAMLPKTDAGVAGIDLGALYLSITSPNLGGRSDDEKTSLRKAWTGKLGAKLASWQFESVNPTALKAQGLDPSSLADNMDIALPYGLKSSVAAVKPTFAGAWAGEDIACGRDHGGYLVLALDVPPPPGKRSEFGTLALTLMAVSSCQTSAGGPGTAGLAARIIAAFAASASGDQK